MSDVISHYGVKGMKWGVRKEEEVVLRKKLKSGGEVIVTKDKPVGLGKLFPKLSEGVANFTLRDSEGKKVGEASFEHQLGSSEMHLEWLGVRKRARGQGYATAAFEGALNYAKDNGVKRLVLEVPESSKDAQHIYTSFGFRPTGKNDKDTELFGFEMELRFDEVKHASRSIMDYILDALDKVEEEETMAHAIRDDVLASLGIDIGDELKHYGVKGMKWGVVRERGANGRVTRTVSSDHEESRVSKKKPVSQMSNAELKRLNERLELERKNNQLQSRSGISKIKKGTEMAGVILAVGTTVSTAYNFVKSPAGQAIISTVKKSLNNS